MTASIILTGCGAALLIPYIYLRVKKRGFPALIIKAAVSVFFLLTAGAAVLSLGPRAPGSSRLCFGVIGGLLFGLLGDIWLDMKDMYAPHKDAYVFTGFFSFLIGHLFFIGGLYAAYGAKPVRLLCAAGIAAAITLFVAVSEKPMNLRYGKFKAITLGYSFALSFMAASAFACAFLGVQTPPLQARIMTAGGVLFLLSDLVLSGTYFGVGKDKPVHIVLNYLLYYGAQFTIALSLAFIG